jgi:hypothetical protein
MMQDFSAQFTKDFHGKVYKKGPGVIIKLWKGLQQCHRPFMEKIISK